MNVIQSNNSTYLKQDVVYNDKLGKVQIGKLKFFGGMKPIKEFDVSEVKEFKQLNLENVEETNKSTLGSLGGAAVGGLLFGGAGAVVGALSNGNKTKHKTHGTFGFNFKNGDWVLFEYEINPDTMVGRMNKAVVDKLFEVFATKVSNPFEVA